MKANDRSRLLLRAALLCSLALPLIIMGLRLHAAFGPELNLVRGEGQLEGDALEASRLHQTLGTASKFGFYHPGPLLAYTLALPYALSGHRAISLIIGCAAITLLSIVCIALCVARWGRSRVAFGVSLGLACIALTSFPQTLTSNWPPYPTLFVFGAFLFAAAGFAAGRFGGLIGVVAAGSFLVETNASYLAPVGACVATACALRWVGDAPRTSLKQWAVAMLLLVSLWLPSIIGEVRSGGENLVRIGVAAMRHKESSGIVWSLARVARNFVPYHLRQAGPTPPFVIASFVLLLVALLLSIRRLRDRDRYLAALGAMSLAAAAAGVILLSRLPAGTYESHYGNWIAMASLGGLVCIAGALGSLRAATATAPTSLASLAIVVVTMTALAALYPLHVVTDGQRNPAVTLMTNAIVEELASRGIADPHPHLDAELDDAVRDSRFGVAEGYYPFAESVLLQLDKRGIAGSITPSYTFWTSGRWARPASDQRFFIGAKAPAGARQILCVATGENSFLPYPVCLYVVSLP